MTKGEKITLIFVVVLFVACLVISFFILHPTESRIVTISRDNEVLYTFDLLKTKDQIIRIEYEDGGYNIIEIKDGTIRISDADCNDRTCVKMGILKSELPIVCQPHHLVIRRE